MRRRHAFTGRLGWVLVIAAFAFLGAGCTKQAKKKRALERAEKDFAAEKYDRAEIEYLAALRVPPPDPRAVLQLGRIYYTQGKYPQAYAYLQKAVELESVSAEVHARFAKACLAVNRLKEAREQALLALDKEPQSGEALLALVEATSATNQVSETLKRLDAVPESSKTRAEFRVARGTLHLRLRELEQAEIEFKAALAADPKCAEAYLGLGTISLSRSNLVAAESAFKTAADCAPVRSTPRLRYADLKLKTGLPEVARKIVEEVTTAAPDYLPAWIFLAQMAYAEQKPDLCDKLIDTVLARDPVNLEARMMKGNLFLAKGDPTNAIAQFERIQSVFGKIPGVQYGVALAQLQMRETAKARSALSEVLSAQPNFPEAVLLNANLLIRAGDASAAAASLSRLLKEQPRYFQAYVYLAEAYLAQRKTGEAIAVYQQMATLFPQSPEVYVMLGSLYVQQQKSAEARTAFEKTLEIAPDYLLAREKLIDMDLSENNFDAAADRVRNHLAAKPASAEPWLLSAKVHIAQALHSAGVTNAALLEESLRARLAASAAAQAGMREAESALLKAIELRPDLTLSYMMLAQLYVRTDRHQQALERLDILASTNSPGALLQIGLIQTELKNYPAARDAYEKMIASNPRESAALNNLAYLYTEQLNDLGKAYQMAQKARDLLPHDPRTADTLGWVLYKRGDYERAMALLQEAAAKLAMEPEVQFHLGMTHYMAGEEGPARVALERALQSSKSFPGKEQARKCLDVLGMDVSGTDVAKLAELRLRAAREPDDVVLLLRLAELSERNSQFGEARDTYEALLKKNPRNGRIQFKLARLYSERLEQPVKAMELAKSAHALLPEDAEINALLGRLAFRERDYQWALSLLQEAARKLPDKAELIYDLALAHYSLGNVADAESMMQAALAGTPFAYEQQAKSFLRLVTLAKDPAGARAGVTDAQTLIQKQSDNVPALMVVALAQEQDGDFSGARSTYEKILATYPLFSPATKNLAFLCAFRLGDDQKAYELAMKAREALPRDREVARTLGIVTFRRSDYARALPYLDQSAQAQPEDAEVQFCKGMAHYRLKQPAAGEKALQHALRLNLDARMADEAKKALEEIGKGS